MANTMSAKKAIRSSQRKRDHNLFWKRRIRDNIKTLKKEIASKQPKVDILNTQLMKLQKVLDKAAKEKVVHKNKADRLKSIYAKKISVLSQEKTSKGKAKTKK